MALSDYKITQEETAANGVVSAPDVLTGTAQENKAVFDKLINQTVMVKHNGLIDELSTSGAGDTGITDIPGLVAETVQEALEEINANVGEIIDPNNPETAGKIGSMPFQGVEAANVQDALEEIQQNLDAAVSAIQQDIPQAEEVPVTPFPGVTSDNVQDALEELNEKVEDIQSGVIPSGSITSDMIQDGAITPDKLASGAGGGSILTVTFANGFQGATYTLTGGDESYSGTVPASLEAVHSLLAIETQYTLTVTDSAEEENYTRTIQTLEYFTALEVSIAPFAATITVTCPAGSTVTCVNGSTTLQQTATSGTAVFTVTSAGTWEITATLDGETATGEVVISASGEQKTITLAYVHIYGVLWDGTSTTALSRTDDAAGFSDPVPAVSGGSGSSPFDTLLPWSGMVRSTDPQAGELVAIPKYWYKWTKSGSTIKLQIADGPAEGFLVSPAHCDRGDGHGERDVVYVGRYHCHTSNWKSQTGGKPKADITRSTARSGIHNLGGSVWQWDWAMSWTIKMLYLVEYADWNSQAKIGYGCGNNSATENMGATDGMTYHTGTSKANRTTYGVGVQYRHIEGLWDNVYDWVDGCYYSSAGLNIILNPSNFSDSSGGTSIGTPTSGYPSALGVKTALNGMWIIPTAARGSDSTYVPDNWDFSAGNPCLYLGGNYSQNQNHGLFCVSYGTASGSSSSIGSRLMKLP